MAKNSKSATANKSVRDATAAGNASKSTEGTGAAELVKSQAKIQQGAIEALKQDHRRVGDLFSMICSELNIHTRLEEELSIRPVAKPSTTKISWTRLGWSTTRPRRIASRSCRGALHT